MQINNNIAGNSIEDSIGINGSSIGKVHNNNNNRKRNQAAQ
jgi:hypothetical protein